MRSSQGQTPAPPADDPKAVLLVCFGGFSNTGYLTGLGAMQAVSKVGLGQACIACLAGVPTGSASVIERIRNARSVVVVDGCATACARKIAETASLRITKSITLTSDLGIEKIPFRQRLDVQDPLDLIPAEEIARVADAIIDAIGR